VSTLKNVPIEDLKDQLEAIGDEIARRQRPRLVYNHLSDFNELIAVCKEYISAIDEKSCDKDTLRILFSKPR